MAQKEVAFKVVVDTSEVDENIEKSIQSVDELGTATAKTSKEMQTGFKAAEQGTKGLGTSIGGIVKALGLIGVAMAVFDFLREIVMKNQKVVDSLGVALKTIEILMNELFKAIEPVGKILKSAFENPQQAIKDLITGTFNRLITSLKGIGVVAEAVGIQIKGALTLDFDEVKRGLQQYAQGLAQVATGMDVEAQNRFIDGIKNVGAAAIDTASKIQSLAKEVKLAEAQQRLLMLQYQQEAEIQRQIRDDVSLTIAERQEANIKLGTILTKQSEDELALANKKKELAQLELSINKDSIDNQIGLINAETEIADIRERITGQRSEQLVNTNSLIRENTELIKTQQAAIEAEALAEAEAAFKILEAKVLAEETLKAYLSERQTLSREEMIQKEIDDILAIEEAKFQAAVEAAQIAGELQDELDNLELARQDEFFRLENEIRAKWGEEQIKLEQEIADKEDAIRQAELKKDQDAKKKLKDEEEKLKKIKIQAALDVGRTLGVIASAIENQGKEGLAASKVLAISQLAIATAVSIGEAIAGASSAAKAGGPAAPFLLVSYIATMVGTVVGAITQATSILNKVPGGGTATPANVSIASTTAAAAPSFDPVTTNTTELGNTQAAELAPIQAFVVETQLTNTQNNIGQIEGQATFGGG
jgi:hypothetical protein